MACVGRCATSLSWPGSFKNQDGDGEDSTSRESGVPECYGIAWQATANVRHDHVPPRTRIRERTVRSLAVSQQDSGCLLGL